MSSFLSAAENVVEKNGKEIRAVELALEGHNLVCIVQELCFSYSRIIIFIILVALKPPSDFIVGRPEAALLFCLL